MPEASNIFSLLPASRRKILESEAVALLIRILLIKNYKKTFGVLVEDLSKNQHWSLMKNVKVSSILTPRDEKSKRGRPRETSPKMVETVFTAIKENPNLRTEQLRKKIPLDRNVVRGILAELRRDGRVKTSGHRRTMTYKAA